MQHQRSASYTSREGRPLKLRWKLQLNVAVDKWMVNQQKQLLLSITPELLLTCFLLLQKGILEQVSEVFWSTKTASFSQVKSGKWTCGPSLSRPRGLEAVPSLPGVLRKNRPQSLRKTWSCSCFYTFAQVTQCGMETSLGPGMLCCNATPGCTSLG